MTVLLQISDISKHYGPVVILENATASFSDDQKIGVIGRNGAGKSTLCRIITGQEEKDSGSISANSAMRMSYLEQHDVFKPEETVRDFLIRYTDREEWECAEMAARFHLKDALFEAPITSLAGGYRTRVKLAAMLLKDPNFLILDEPTNYLDLSTLILLENFLQEFRGGYLIVSHDREFLRKTCDHTLEVEQGRLTLYPGNIDEYFEFKEEQLRQVHAYNKTVEKKKAQLQEFVDRFKAKASTASRAKSKMKAIDRLETIEVARPLSTVRMRIPSVEAKGGIALTIDDLAIGYPGKTVASRIHLEVERGAHVAVLGDNGQGKTTFFRTIAGDLAPLGGKFQWGTGLKIAYYAQHVFQTLHPEDDIFTHLSREAAPGVGQQDILDMAGGFLFKGEEVKKKVAVLSGGERARLVLAGMLLTRSHILLMDEPTNHLDFETVEALAEALKTFAGTVFFISHDRTFVRTLATHILDIKNGFISRYPGTYEEYVYFLERQAREEIPDDESPASSGYAAPAPAVSKEDAQKSAEDQARADEKQKQAEVREFTKKVEKQEGRLQHVQRQRDQVYKEIEVNPLHFSKERNLKIKELTVQIEKEEAKYLALLEELEKLKSKP